MGIFSKPRMGRYAAEGRYGRNHLSGNRPKSPLASPESDLMEPKGMGWFQFLLWLVILSVALALVWRAPSLNTELFKNNKNMIPLTGSLWILILPETTNQGEKSDITLLKLAEPLQPGAAAGPGMMYLRLFDDGLVRPVFYFPNLPQAGDRPPLLPFRYQVDDSEEQLAMGGIQGYQILMLHPVKEGFDDLGPELLAAAAQGRKLRVALEFQPNWIFEVSYDVSEMGLALDHFKRAFEKDKLQP